VNKTLEIAIILSAVDKASRVLNEVFNKQNEKLREMQERSSKFLSSGAGLVGAGVALGASLAPAISAFSDLEDSSIALKNAMTDGMNIVNPLFERVNASAIDLGNRLPGTTADFQNMFQVLLNNGVPAKSILDGVGQSAAYLAVSLKMPYEEAAQFAARLKVATGVADEDMNKFFDTIQRTQALGIQAGEMQYAFGRSSGALKLMGIQGLEASKSISTLYAMILRGGLSGETTGTGFAAILNGLLDPKKIGKMNDAAKELGVSLSFFDNAGNFKGVENFVAQFDKLKGFSAEQRAGVVNALTGGGQDSQMLQTIISNGIEGYRKLNQEQQSKMALDAKVETQLTSLKNTWEAAMGNMTNALAAFGAALAPVLKDISTMIGKFASWAQQFFDAHPKVAKLIGTLIGFSSAALIVVGGIFLIKGAMVALNAVLLANPWVLLAMAVVAVVAIIYTYWDDIVAFFKWVWDGIKNIFTSTWDYIKNLFMQYHPAGIIYRHWDGIVAWFGALWDKIIAGIQALGERFIQAGENIVNSIKKGIENKWEDFKGWWGEKMQGIRDFLPFSPAKTGPLRDIHKLKLMETIAASVKMEPLRNAMTRSTSMAMSSVPKTLASVSGGNRSYGGTSIVYSPNITIGAGGNTSSLMDELQRHKDELMRMISEYDNRKQRLSYS
jgi:TP901 family phage tail tape measure protein